MKFLTTFLNYMQSIRHFKSFTSSIEAIYLVEASPTMRETQKQLLCGDAPMEETEMGHKSKSTHLGIPVIWTEHIRFLPSGTPPPHVSLELIYHINLPSSRK